MLDGCRLAFGIMTSRGGTGRLVEPFDVVHKSDVARHIFASARKIVRTEVPLPLKISELLVDASLDLLRRERR
jgi:hypothetical protein